MLESVQIILFASVSGITDRHVWVSAVKCMEIIHVQGISGDITGALINDIVQDKRLVGAYLRVVSGLELTVLHVVFFHAP